MSNFSQFFNEEWYLAQNPDVAAAVNAGLLTALDHFTHYGATEGRSPLSFFDVDFYLSQNPDVAQAVDAGLASAVQHFLLYGVNEPRQISVAINMDDYLSANPDVAEAVEMGQVSALAHLMQYGVTEGRDLGNGISLTQFANDPAFQQALDSGKGLDALARLEEVAPFIPGFKAPANWTPPANLSIPVDFVPVEGQQLVIPAGVIIPADADLPAGIFAPVVEAPISGGSGGSPSTGGGSAGGGDADTGGDSDGPSESEDNVKTLTINTSTVVTPEDTAGATTLAVTVNTPATVAGAADAVNVDLSQVPGLETLASINSQEKLAFINVNDQVELTIKGGVDYTSNRKNIILNYASNEDNQALADQVINLENAKTQNITVQVVEESTYKESSFKTLNLNVTGDNHINRAGTYNTDSNIHQSSNTEVVIKGSGSLTWDILDGAVQTFDATEVTGNVFLQRITAKDLTALNTGAGEDTINVRFLESIQTEPTRTIKVDAGAGDDVISAKASGSLNAPVFELTGGAGADKFVINGNGNTALIYEKNLTDNTFYTNIVITDFSNEEGDILIIEEFSSLTFLDTDIDFKGSLVSKIKAAEQALRADLGDTNYVDDAPGKLVSFEHSISEDVANTYVVYVAENMATVIELIGVGKGLETNSNIYGVDYSLG